MSPSSSDLTASLHVAVAVVDAAGNLGRDVSVHFALRVEAHQATSEAPTTTLCGTSFWLGSVRERGKWSALVPQALPTIVHDARQCGLCTLRIEPPIRAESRRRGGSRGFLRDIVDIASVPWHTLSRTEKYMLVCVRGVW